MRGEQEGRDEEEASVRAGGEQRRARGEGWRRCDGQRKRMMPDRGSG